MDTTRELGRFIQVELADDQDAVIGPDDDLLDQGILDSAGIAQLLAFIEERFAITVGDDELVPENFSSINAIKGLIATKLVPPV